MKDQSVGGLGKNDYSNFLRWAPLDATFQLFWMPRVSTTAPNPSLGFFFYFFIIFCLISYPTSILLQVWGLQKGCFLSRPCAAPKCSTWGNSKAWTQAAQAAVWSVWSMTTLHPWAFLRSWAKLRTVSQHWSIQSVKLGGAITICTYHMFSRVPHWLFRLKRRPFSRRFCWPLTFATLCFDTNSCAQRAVLLLTHPQSCQLAKNRQ